MLFIHLAQMTAFYNFDELDSVKNIPEQKHLKAHEEHFHQRERA